MHGQKKRRKRSLDGVLEVAGFAMRWTLVSEPLLSSEDGYQGLCISVRTEDEAHRELLLKFPYPKNTFGSPLPLPQRPKFSEGDVHAGVRSALAAGWNPASRGKAFLHLVTPSNEITAGGCT